MTFDHGDYAQIEAVPENEKVAESLYQKALDYFPNQRAFLGLGILMQKKNDYAASVEILSCGLEHFPDDSQLNICLGVSLMNLGQYPNALIHFLKFENVKEAVYFAAQCYKMTRADEKASILNKKLETM
jgi:tetratricopeptide (TPR) repeat protein